MRVIIDIKLLILINVSSYEITYFRLSNLVKYIMFNNILEFGRKSNQN